MLVKSDISALLLAGLKTQFFETFAAYPSLYETVCTVVPSSKDTETYAWLGALPGVNEWLDERQLQEFSEYSYQIKNRKWESTVAVDRAAIEDDQYGQVAAQVRHLGASAKQHIDLLVWSMLEGGFANPCFDGTPFFNTAHPVKAGTASNMATLALNTASLQTAVTAMQRQTSDQGRIMGINPTHLIVPPELQWTAYSLMNSTFFPDPTGTANYQNLGANALKGTLEVVTVPYLQSTSHWYLLDATRAVKALVFQLRREFEFSALEAQTDNGFWRDQYLYGVRARYNVGYGDWRCAFASNN